MCLCFLVVVDRLLDDELRLRVLVRALVRVRVLRVCALVLVRVLRVLRVRRHVLRSWFPPTPGNPGTPPVRVLVRVRRT